MATVEEQVKRDLGREGLTSMVADFYRRVKEDDLIGPMYPEDDWEGSEERLLDFLCFRLLGESAYLLKRGHPRLRMRHAPFSIGEAERDRWLEMMEAAMIETKVPDETREALGAFFAQVADFMRNQ
ncbi:globin [Haloferula rosea]|uniref:Globin n=1 Tax=Haloferula rosea TaxID=490093 RepID=A0A934RE11_9BACT|nr:globin [Haloferula rosea]MBK1826851.1 globin [Haloferula rosea]